jgi:hypothetical protein
MQTHFAAAAAGPLLGATSYLRSYNVNRLHTSRLSPFLSLVRVGDGLIVEVLVLLEKVLRMHLCIWTTEK